jgi:hypothetical protein
MITDRKLTLADIADTRAYERERADFRARMIDTKERRRVHLGTIVSVSFENRDTMRYQIQEMARVEGLKTDAEIQEELDIYNAVIPDPGHLSATLFIELTSDAQMREWLPKLVGIERSLVFQLPDGSTVRSEPEAGHAAQLTRAHVTAAVHYLTWSFTPAQVDAFIDGARLVIDHPAYLEVAELRPATVAELRTDLLP